MTLPQADGAGPEALRAVLDTVFQGGEYRWVQRPHPFAFLARWWDALREALAGLEETHPDLFWVLFWALVGVLLLIFAHAAWVMVQTIRAAAAPPAGATSPAAVARGAAWYRAEARRLAAGGAYAEAMQADFAALVLELDARRVVRFHPSKPPNEYTYEAETNGSRYYLWTSATVEAPTTARIVASAPQAGVKPHASEILTPAAVFLNGERLG